MINFPTDVTRVCFAGDWHANYSYSQRALEWAGTNGAQVLLHVGDFGYKFSAGYLDALNQIADNFGMILMFVDGNHEDFDWLLDQPVDEDGVRRLRERVWHLPRGFRWTWSETRFLALGGAPSIDKEFRTPHVSWWPQEEITLAEAYAVVAAGEADVMITHDAPEGTEIPGISGNPQGWPDVEIATSDRHRRLLRSIVDVVKPGFLFHGHYHVPYYEMFEGTHVFGLHMDGTPFNQNMSIWDVKDLKESA